MRYFRGEKLIDREKDMEFFMDWFEKIPKEILWVYGPKSSGKTTVIEYVVENELYEDFEKEKLKKGYWVKYMNLRRKLISSYETFLEAFIKPESDNKKKEERFSASVNVGIFEIKEEILREVKERKKDLFDVLINEIDKIKKKGRRPILIIDEIQTLEDIYINGDRELLKEFLNFCVSLSKETHLSHIVILSSNTIFIDRIYNDAKLKETSKFYKIDHLDKKTTEEWLKGEKLSKEEIDLLWEYFGGSIPRIQRYLRERDKVSNLKEYLDRQAFLAYTEIIDLLTNEPDFKKRDIFKDIAKEIVNKGEFLLKEKSPVEIKEIVRFYAEKEIFFYDPLELKVTGNNRIYEKGMEKVINS